MMRSERLPTRVSNACDRCRRQKQRCENARPCSNCVNSRQECQSSEQRRLTSHSGRASKRTRTSNEDQSGAVSDQRHDYPEIEIRHEVFPESGRTTQGIPGSHVSQPRGSDSSWREQSIVTEFGNSSSTVDVTRRVLLSRDSMDGSPRATFAIPGGEAHEKSISAQKLIKVSQLVGVELPASHVCDALIDVYFFTVHWFSLVVHEPSFRKRSREIIRTGLARANDRPFVFLLLVVLGMACQYGEGFLDDTVQHDLDLQLMRSKYMNVVRQNLMDLLDEDCLEFVQICILIGSYWLYWGKPKASFGLLGAATRSAQALLLHRQSGSRQFRQNSQSIEERKRVWWTIYTWDRFATIVYGRPLGVSDRDCDVQMPASYKERVKDIETTETGDVDLSEYQVQLNHIYRIASPLLSNIYGIRGYSSALDMAKLNRSIDGSMRQWRRELPPSLILSGYPDLSPASTLEVKMHQLQALSLELTYHNLLIIIHRPLLADWSYRRGRESRKQSTVPAHARPPHEQAEPIDREIYESSFAECLNAASTVANIEKLKPNLIQLAGRTHLVSFLGMNIFTASVVLFICAMSDILSDSSQEAKRGISRNLRTLRLLPGEGLLSKQCRAIIEDLVSMIMEKEREEILQNSAADGWSRAPKNDLGMTPSAEVQGNGLQTSANATETVTTFDEFEPALGRTMEQLNQVLRDAAAYHRGEGSTQQPMPIFRENSLSGHGYNTFPRNESQDAEPMPTDASQMPDMGQFWLWDISPMHEDSGFWNIVDYDL